jgi:hypothetical protein
VFLVGTMAREAIVRENRPYLAVKIHSRTGRSKQWGQARAERENNKVDPHLFQGLRLSFTILCKNRFRHREDRSSPYAAGRECGS